MSLLSSTWEPPSPLTIQTVSLVTSLLIILLPLAVTSLLPAQSWFSPFLTLQDLYPSRNEPGRARWKTIALSSAAAVQLFLSLRSSWMDGADWKIAGGLGACWAYAAAYPLVARRKSTANLSVLGFYFVQLVSSFLSLISPLYPDFDSPVRLSDVIAMVLDLLLIAVTLSLATAELPSSYLENQEKLVAQGSKGILQFNEFDGSICS